MFMQALRIYHAFSPFSIRLSSILGILPMTFFIPAGSSSSSNSSSSSSRFSSGPNSTDKFAKEKH